MHWTAAADIVAMGLPAAACAERVADNAVTGCMMINKNISKVPKICTAW